uniref:Molecular chaperone HtpG n=1 Tax=Candidatus Kentrum sp. FM TaxID=2126340 RepID=A0A450S042_9GAMM|nr:MAG: molecular chaperone HtpG [Candidatus Kentron sp. FM]VFJ45504.1 MAG: molecular chaperone HtpG [Candidatus Kentron sp. FM]VFK06700.1 MAG: molecular chaperone HtpG [Candidatus Kentron sp. FM]
MQHTISINLPGLLRMLGENIYAEPDVAIREMIQNAHDTCIIRGNRDPGAPAPGIHVSFDRGQRTITIADNGAGMTEAELHKNLATIGESFTRLQREELKEKDAREAALLIGQFGIGLLSAFSISERVEVITRSYQGDGAFRWVCEGDIHYTLEPLDEMPLDETAFKPDPGSRITLHLLDTKLELLDDARLRQAIKKYADFLSIPIFLNGNQANVCTPPWEQDSGSALSESTLSDYIQQRWGLYPLAILPFDTETTSSRQGMPGTSARDGNELPLRVSGLLFVPAISFELARDFGELDIHISRMFIKANDKELLPGWARFVKGVIDTPDLTPTLSRGELIGDANYRRLQEWLGALIIAWLDNLQEHDPERLKLLVGSYNNTIKARALEDDGFFDRICHLVRVNTDRGKITLGEYLESSGNTLYYFAERGSGTQHKVLFAHKGLPVIDASWGVEEEFLEKYAERRGCRIERLTAGAGTIFTVPETLDDKWHALEREFHHETKMEAKAVAFDPQTVPAVLMARPLEKDDKQLAELDAMGAELGIRADTIKQMFGKMAKSKQGRLTSGDATIVHLNIKNPLMIRLRDMPHNETRRLAVLCIYNNAHLFANHYVTPENAERIFDSNNQAFSAMITTAQELARVEEENARIEMERDELKRKVPKIRLTEHRSCFFAFDYNIEDNYALLKEIQGYFREKELGIEVIAPAKGMGDLNIQRNLIRQLQQVHFGIAEVSNNNPNVLYEAGFLHALGKPVILLKRKDSNAPVPFDIFSDFRGEYKVDNDQGEIEFIRLKRQLDLAMNAVRHMLPGFADTPKWAP